MYPYLSSASEPISSKKYVLLVDNDETLCEGVKRQFARHSGYIFHNVSTGQACLDFCGKVLPDCILVDYQLPDCDGIELIQRIQDAFSIQPPIILFTGFGNEYIAKEAIKQGAADYLNKSMLDKVFDTVKTVVDQGPIGSKIEKLVHYDSLTGLYNRYYFEICLKTYVEYFYEAYELYLVYLDLDDFKVINDTYSHAMGDAVLVEVAKRLQLLMRHDDVIARIGGDEFAIIVKLAKQGKSITAICDSIVQIINQPIHVEKYQFQVGCSVGLAKYSRQISSPARLVECADRAMYCAKQSGKNHIVVYSQQIERRKQNRERTILQLKEAIENKALQLRAQPVVNTQLQRCESVEALTRWELNQASIMPGEFIPLAVESGCINELNNWLFHTLLGWLAEAPNGNDLSFSCNLSKKELYNQKIVDNLVNLFEQYNIDLKRLILEVTASNLACGFADAKGSLEALQAQGVRVRLDNVGNEPIIFEQLEALGIDALKVDRGIIQAAQSNAGAYRVFGSILEIAKLYDLNVIANGVETASQAEWLNSLGCHLHQGYYYAKPVALEAVNQLVAEIGSRTHQNR